MKIEIVEEKKNPLLGREELTIKIVHDKATPSLSEVRDKIIAMKNASKDTVIVDSFKSRFGVKESVGFVKIYKIKERALQVEPRHRLEKNSLVEKTKKAEKPKPEKPAGGKSGEPKKEAPQPKPKQEAKPTQPKLEAKQEKPVGEKPSEPKKEVKPAQPKQEAKQAK